MTRNKTIRSFTIFCTFGISCVIFRKSQNIFFVLKFRKVVMNVALMNFLDEEINLVEERMTEIFSKILLLMIVSNMFLDSWTLFVLLSSNNTWSYSEVEAMKRIEVTDSKHWNHFCLCVR